MNYKEQKFISIHVGNVSVKRISFYGRSMSITIFGPFIMLFCQTANAVGIDQSATSLSRDDSRKEGSTFHEE